MPRFQGTPIETEETQPVKPRFQGAPVEQVEIQGDEIEVPEWGRKHPNLYGMYGALKGMWEQAGKPTVELGAMAGGAMVGAPLGPAGMVAGAGLAHGAAKQITERIGEEKPLKERLTTAGEDIVAGAEMEAGGQVIGKAAPVVARMAGKPVKSAIAGLTGTGRGAVETTIEAGKGAGPGLTFHPLKTVNDFDRALRGKITGEEIVQNARSALRSMKNLRQADYIKDLAEISKNNKPIDIKPVRNKFYKLIDEYGIKLKYDIKKDKYSIDASRAAMSRKGVKDLEDIFEIIEDFGTKDGDNTAIGLDTLKRQLDDFYSESRGASAFVTNLRNKVKNTIINDVPQYKEMMNNYSEATTLIKDIEADLMLRKQGMTGRITADKTLRRLMTAMKSAKGERYEIRGDLIRVLGSQGQSDLMEQIAGYAMNELRPRGISGTGTGMVAHAALTQLNPAFYATLAASSPRIAGEFLRAWGKMISEFSGTSGPAGRTAVKFFKEREG